jgi:hypothetical protein
MSGQLHAPAALSPRKEPPAPLDRRLGGPHNQSGRRGEKKILDLIGTRTPTPVAQPVASCYTDCAILIHNVFTHSFIHSSMALQPFVGALAFSSVS